MANHEFFGGAFEVVGGSSPLGTGNPSDFYLVGGTFKVSIQQDGTVLLFKKVLDNYTAFDAGPYTGAQLLQLWQDLAEVGFTI